MTKIKNITLLSISALVFLSITFLPVKAEDNIIKNGVMYDDHIKYTLYDDGTLVFEGNGDVDGFNMIHEYYYSTWYNEYRDKIKNIIFGNGI